MKKINLFIDGQEKEFSIPFVSGLAWRKYIGLCAEVQDLQALTPEEMDKFVDLVVMEFNNQFTAEQYYKGLPFNETLLTVDKLFLPSSDGTEGNGKK